SGRGAVRRAQVLSHPSKPFGARAGAGRARAPAPPRTAPLATLARMALAVVDIGSNSVRLVVYEALSRAPAVMFNEKAASGLGRGVATTGLLPADGVENALAALSRFRVLCEVMDVHDVRGIATAAARDARNGGEFLAR